MSPAVDERVSRNRLRTTRAGASGAAPQASGPQHSAARQLAAAHARIAELTEQVFELQEQNQQLRKDLAQRVCPRLCTRPYRSAS